ncbi:hypothetical protein BC628DRAFT_67190 [Trametes gibbosa]|nr:hypothetical protein BC628DRAFT_67190 [Trametes gibbosa]
MEQRQCLTCGAAATRMAQPQPSHPSTSTSAVPPSDSRAASDAHADGRLIRAVARARCTPVSIKLCAAYRVRRTIPVLSDRDVIGAWTGDSVDVVRLGLLGVMLGSNWGGSSYPPARPSRAGCARGSLGGWAGLMSVGVGSDGSCARIWLRLGYLACAGEDWFEGCRVRSRTPGRSSDAGRSEYRRAGRGGLYICMLSECTSSPARIWPAVAEIHTGNSP